MSLSGGKSVWKIALLSRILVFALQVIFNLLIPDHDAGAFDPPVPRKNKPLDGIIEVLFGGLRRWDGVYFIHIAEYGYTYENTLAFFPFFVMCTRIMSYILYPLSYICNETSVLVCSAVLLNLILFIIAAQALYNLSLRVLKDDSLAFKATLLFCVNPASIFFTAPYSETLFACLTFIGLLQQNKGRSYLASIFYGLSGFTRSNGVVNVGFILYDNTKECCHQTVTLLRSRVEGRYVKVLKTIVVFFIHTCLQVCICVTPFILYQFYSYKRFCDIAYKPTHIPQILIKYGRLHDYKFPNDRPSSWCHDALPLAYSYVQTELWHQGLFNYYEFKQIPNFFLAAPMVIICVLTIVSYVQGRFMYCVTLGLYEPESYKNKKTDSEEEMRSPFYNDNIYVYIVHLTFLITVAVLCMHVQVTTRFIASSSPVIYWFIATITSSGKTASSSKYSSIVNHDHLSRESIHGSKEESMSTKLEEMYDWNETSLTHKALFAYFHFYFFIGCAAFSNFLPWT